MTKVVRSSAAVIQASTSPHGGERPRGVVGVADEDQRRPRTGGGPHPLQVVGTVRPEGNGGEAAARRERVLGDVLERRLRDDDSGYRESTTAPPSGGSRSSRCRARSARRRRRASGPARTPGRAGTAAGYAVRLAQVLENGASSRRREAERILVRVEPDRGGAQRPHDPRHGRRPGRRGATGGQQPARRPKR